MYSQNDEEAHILKHLGDRPPGRLLDIGANDGRYLSNSLALIERGWSGLLVEANPITFAKLVGNHLSNPRLKLVNAAIGTEHRLTRFWHSTRDGAAIDPHAGLSTTELQQRNARAGAFLEPFYVPMVPLYELFRLFPGPIDFLSIDTEGTSADLFGYFFGAYLHVGLAARASDQPQHPSVICVEHDAQLSKCRDLASRFGYHEVCGDAENLIFVAEDLL